MTTNRQGNVVVIPPSPPGVTKTAETGLRPARPPVEIPNPWIWVWLAAAVLLALGAWLAWKKSRSPVRKKEPAQIPPHRLALDRLSAAEFHISDPPQFCALVSSALRHYLEDRFSVHAPDRTTEELLHELAGTKVLETEPQEMLLELLERCDRVKFARDEPTLPDLQHFHGAAVRFVNETAPSPALVTP